MENLTNLDDDGSMAMKSDIKIIMDHLKTISNKQDDHTAMFEEIRATKVEMLQKMEEIKSENEQLRSKILFLERERAETGIIAFDVPEQDSENLRNVIENHLSIAGCEINVHTSIRRMGKKAANKKRPVMIRFLSNNERNLNVTKLINFNKMSRPEQRIPFKCEMPTEYNEVEKKHISEIKEARAQKKRIQWRNHMLWIDGVAVESALGDGTQRNLQQPQTKRHTKRKTRSQTRATSASTSAKRVNQLD